MKKTALQRSAFWLLGASTRDERKRIVELAEERSLQIDNDACQQSRADLTSPRTRLRVEMAWLPGVSPTKAFQLAAQVLESPHSIRVEKGLPVLAHANLMAAAFEVLDDNQNPQDIADFIQQMAYLVDKLSIDDIIRDVNEDRAISRFPLLKTDQVEAELAERKRYYRNAIKEALNQLPTSTLIEVITLAVESATHRGETHAPELIDELVDTYEVESQEFLQKEAENVHTLIKAIYDSVPSGENAVKPLIEKLDLVIRNWDKVAQPIQLSTKARGIQHPLSNALAYSIRSLAIDLFNEHGLLTQSQHLTSLLQDLFSELPEVTERVEQDANALQEVFEFRKKNKAQQEEWAREITYKVELGMIFKNTLSISSDGLAWKNQRYSLDAITGVRWGGVRNSTYGIPTGTTYTLAFGDARSEAVIDLKDEEVFSIFIEKLWRGVGIRLLIELLQALKDGNEISFGESLIRDDGAVLIKHKMFGNESIWCSWQQAHIWISEGHFYIGSKVDKKAYVELSYIHVPNVHILETAIRMAFKRPGMCRLSEGSSEN